MFRLKQRRTSLTKYYGSVSYYEYRLIYVLLRSQGPASIPSPAASPTDLGVSQDSMVCVTFTLQYLY